MDSAAQPQAIGQIVDMAKVTLIAGDVLRPLSIVDALRTHRITKIAHTAANPLLTLGAQKEPYAAINLNIMGTVNVLEAARVTGLKRVVVSSSSVLNHYMEGGADDGDFGKEEAFPRPTTFYAATKQAVESLGLNYAKWCGIEFTGLRYGAVFGPWSGPAAGDPRTSCARPCATRSPGKRQHPAGPDGVGLLQGCGRRHGHGARRQGSRQPCVQRHDGSQSPHRRDGRGDRSRGSRCQGEVRRSGRHRHRAIEPRQRADLGRAKRYLGMSRGSGCRKL